MTDPVALTTERGKDYGPPLRDFDLVQRLFRMLMEHKSHSPKVECDPSYDNAHRHVLYMLCVKLARLAHSPRHLDSMHDIAGYARTLEMCLSSANNTKLASELEPWKVEIPKEIFEKFSECSEG